MVDLGMGAAGDLACGPGDAVEPGYRAYSSEGSLSGELCTSAVIATGNNNGSLGEQDPCCAESGVGAGPGACLQTFQMQGCPVDLEVENTNCACGHSPIAPLPARPHQHQQRVQRPLDSVAGAEAGAGAETGTGDGPAAGPEEEASAYRGSQRPQKSEYTSTAYADPSRLSHPHDASTHAASPKRELFDPRQKAGMTSGNHCTTT